MNDPLDLRVEQAVDLIIRYGGIDGAHHKDWVLDQVLRLLMYDARYKVLRKQLEDEYNEGIAP